jgi:FtsH-binding integral membrane protein
MDTNPQSERSGGQPPRVAVDMMDDVPRSHRMLPVWFFIGVILTIYGVMIFIEGLLEFSRPPDTVLAGSHSPIWWGAIMVVVGVVFTVRNHKPTSGGH